MEMANAVDTPHFPVVGLLGAALMAWCLSCETAREDGGVDLEASTGGQPTRIVGGEETQYQSWQSAIMLRDGDPICSGILVHPRLVMTAGHCIQKRLDDDTFIIDYTTSPESIQITGGPRGTTVYSAVAEVALHPGWSGASAVVENDIALLLLRDDVTDVAPAALRIPPFPEVGARATIAGYGSDMIETDMEKALVHRAGETELLQVTETFFEMGGTANSCAGDSGGPVFTEQDGEWVVSGVISYGTTTCQMENGGFALNILGYCSWIERTAAELLNDSGGLRCSEGDAPLVDDNTDKSSSNGCAVYSRAATTRHRSFFSSLIGLLRVHRNIL